MRGVGFVSILVPLALFGCGESEQPKPKPQEPSFDQRWLPEATGDGNLLVCIASDTDPEELDTITMPERTIFQSWGKQLGPLRDRKSFDPKSIMTGPEAREMSSYAVISAEPFTLSPAKPCAKVKASALVSKGFRWSHEVVPASLHYMFQAEDLTLTSEFTIPGGESVLPDSDPVKQALLGGALSATPIGEIDDPVTVIEN